MTFFNRTMRPIDIFSTRIVRTPKTNMQREHVTISSAHDNNMDIETPSAPAINECCNGSTKCKRGNSTNKMCRVNKSILSYFVVGGTADVATNIISMVTQNVNGSCARKNINNNNNNHHNHNNNNSYSLCNNKKCDFFNFCTILFTIFMIFNVQFTSALIEIQNEKEKHGE